MEDDGGCGHSEPVVSADEGYIGLVMFVHSLVSCLYPKWSGIC